MIHYLSPSRRLVPAWQAAALVLLGAILLLAACKREERLFHTPPPPSGSADLRLSTLVPGAGRPPASPHDPLEENAYALSEGKRLFSAFNCVGCHGNGGGNIGPPLMDAKWIYGSQPEQIFATITQGRPNGMPSFRGKIPDAQVWQLVAYVRSLSGQVPQHVAPGRNDHMKSNPPENSVDPLTPKETGIPPSAEHPE